MIKIAKRLADFFLSQKQQNIAKSEKVFDYYKEENIRECYIEFKKYFKKAVVFKKNAQTKEYAINLALKNNDIENSLYLEFGVFKGESINFFSNKIKTNIYGFDSFEGHSHNWPATGTVAKNNHYNQKGILPKVNSNVILIKGFIEDTLGNFLEEKKKEINFIHIDVDIYEPTYTILKNTKPYLKDGGVILFNALYNYVGWDTGQYKALKEVYNDEEFIIKALSIYGPQGVVQIVKK